MKNKLGVDTIIILVAVIVVALLLIIVLANKGEEIEEVEGAKTSGLSQAIQKANDPEILKFNARLTIAEGNQNGQIVKVLVKRIEDINAAGERTVKLVGAENLEDSASYNVSMEKRRRWLYKLC